MEQRRRIDFAALTDSRTALARVPLLLLLLVPALLGRRTRGTHSATLAAMVSPRLLSVVIFPPLAATRLGGRATTPDADTPVPPLPLHAHRPMGTQN